MLKSFEVDSPKGMTIEKPTGILKATRRVGASIANDQKTQQSVQEMKRNASEAKKVIKGIGAEVYSNPKIRESIRRVGTFVLLETGVSTGIIKHSTETGRPMISPWDVKRALFSPADTGRKVWESTKLNTPSLKKDILEVLPGAIWDYESKNPGSLKSGVKAVSRTAVSGAATSVNAARAAVTAAREIHAENREIRANNTEAFRIGSEVMQAQRAGLNVSVLPTVGGNMAVVPNAIPSFEQQPHMINHNMPTNMMHTAYAPLKHAA